MNSTNRTNNNIVEFNNVCFFISILLIISRLSNESVLRNVKYNIFDID